MGDIGMGVTSKNHPSQASHDPFWDEIYAEWKKTELEKLKENKDFLSGNIRVKVDTFGSSYPILSEPLSNVKVKIEKPDDTEIRENGNVSSNSLLHQTKQIGINNSNSQSFNSSNNGQFISNSGASAGVGNSMLNVGIRFEDDGNTSNRNGQSDTSDKQSTQGPSCKMNKTFQSKKVMDFLARFFCDRSRVTKEEGELVDALLTYRNYLWALNRAKQLDVVLFASIQFMKEGIIQHKCENLSNRIKWREEKPNTL